MHIFSACPVLYGMKLFDCLPSYIADILRGVNDLRELRVRNGGAVKANIAGRWYYVGKNSLCSTQKMSVIADTDVCDQIVKTACANSVYAYERTLANGFFSLEDGVRIGVCGQVYGTDRNVFQHYTSLCFRVPHYVNCATNDLLNKCKSSNTLIIGKPGSGKTTLLRDLAVKLGQSFNVLVADERGEIFYDDNLLASSGCDVLKWSDKAYAFEIGVRAMSPNFIVCDELSETDVNFVRSCTNSGVKLICSAHGSGKQDFDERFGLLDRFGVVVTLDGNGKNISY